MRRFIIVWRRWIVTLICEREVCGKKLRGT